MVATQAREVFEALRGEMRKVIVGQEHVLEEIVVVLLSGGHALLEGVPGTAKTLMAKALSMLIGGDFKRVQFTPDLMPSDLIGTQVFEAKTASFFLRRGPIFTNVLLADEINRTPPKTQAALLEAMEERQVTIEGERLPLPEPFLVLATQNPVEYEGTFPLPEAQIDRFMFKILVKYPEMTEEQEILKRYHQGFNPHRLEKASLSPVGTAEVIGRCQEEIQKVVVRDELMKYVVEVVARTRKDLDLNLGASPRASITLLLAGKTMAALQGRDYLIPDDLKRVAFPALRHRIVLRPEAEIEGLTPDEVIRRVLESVEVPR